MDLLRSVVMSRLTVLDHSLLRFFGWAVCIGPSWGRAVLRYLGLPPIGHVWRLPRQ